MFQQNAVGSPCKTVTGGTISALSYLEITVNNYSGLWEMIRNSYGGLLVDVLEVKVGS